MIQDAFQRIRLSPCTSPFSSPFCVLGKVTIMMKPLLEHYLSPENHIAEQPLMINGHPQNEKQQNTFYCTVYILGLCDYWNNCNCL